MVFYLKVNRLEPYTYRNLQRWLDMIDLYGEAEAYIVSDNEELNSQMPIKLDHKFMSAQIIKSEKKDEEIRYIAENVGDSYWIKAAYAHLTTFYHAMKHGLNSFWNIDADDTTICLSKERFCELIKAAQGYADKNELDAFSLDMWASRTGGTSWSFGISYLKDPKEWLSYMKNHCEDIKWKQEAETIGAVTNIDEFFTYMKTLREKKIYSFYAENLTFIHYSNDFIRRPWGSGVFHWKEGVLHLPIIEHVLKMRDKGVFAIPEKVIDLDISISDEENRRFMVDHMVDIERKFFS